MKKKKRGAPFYMVVLTASALLLMALGAALYIMKDIPTVKALKHLENKPESAIYGGNGELIYLLVPDNRIFVSYNKIPKHVKDAFLAAEDAEFFKHGAVDPLGIARALWKNLVSGRVAQGGSTITQQVIKNLVLGPEKSVLRKVREAILAYRLEVYLKKQDILNLYLNHIYMGHGVYGVEAASQIYFGKHIGNVTRGEAALLAGIVQAPSRYTPKRHPGGARIRQEYVVEQMARKKFIDERRKAEMLNEKIDIREDNGIFSDSHFKDFILTYVQDKYGKDILAERKLSIYATVDPQLQRLAETAVKRGLDLYEQRRGEYAASYHLEKQKWNGFMRTQDRDLKQTGLKTGTTYSILVSERMKEGYNVFIGNEKGFLAIEGFPYKPGDVVKGIYEGVDTQGLHVFDPAKTVDVEGALLCMNVNTGHVLAMVGGRDFETSPYNRAVAAKVQSGSAFKPFIYAAALNKGYHLDSVIPDEPKAYPTGRGRTWTPRNYDGVYAGQVSVRDAVAYSKNAATVELLNNVGIGAVRQLMTDLGINANLQQDLSVALGTSNLTLLDLVKGFSAFANGGHRLKPLFVTKITAADGTVLEENPIQRNRAIPADIAYQMNVLLKGPTDYGTAKGVSRKLGYPVAGKTGTTSNYYDALFVGYSPQIATGVWVGFDTRTSLGKGESGARVCLPIWMRFMATAIRKYPVGDFSIPSAFPPMFEWFEKFKPDPGLPASSESKGETSAEPKPEPRPDPKRESRPETRRESRPGPKPEAWPKIY